jgi:hypothetical protein
MRADRSEQRSAKAYDLSYGVAARVTWHQFSHIHSSLLNDLRDRDAKALQFADNRG